MIQQKNINILPIIKYQENIINAVLHNQVTLICGETGSGKTTQVPQFLYPHFQRILVSQPRRISAITLAQRVAKEMGVELGMQIGYNVRFQQKKSQKTKVTFATDGMTIRQLMIGKQYDVFILDEAHERSINTDVLMAILKKKIKTKNKLQPKFRLVIMSATIQSSKFMRFFETDKLISIQGRSFPTQIYNLLEPQQNYFQATFNAILQINERQKQGDILVFLTGEDEIIGLQRRLSKIKQQNNLNINILMLYSALSHEFQHQVFERQSYQTSRRIILSTNIAQTSVTVPGVRFVIDCGFMKIRNYDNYKLLDMLTIVPVSKANAMQRAGRAGREAPGKCYRLYPKFSYDQLKDYNTPEILRSQLSGPILQLKAIGVPSIMELQFMDQPQNDVINGCLSALREIKCITDEPRQDITPYGRQISKLPLPPRFAHLLLLSLQYRCQQIMLSVLSILSIENLFVSSAVQKGNKQTNLHQILKRFLPQTAASIVNMKVKQNMKSSSIISDHLSKVNLLHAYIYAINKKIFCQQNYVNKNNIKRAVLIREQLQDYLDQIIKDRQKKEFQLLAATQIKKSKQIPKGNLDFTKINAWLKCMNKGSIFSTARLTKQGKYQIYKSGQQAYIHPQSLVFFVSPKPPIIVFSQVVKTTKIYLKQITPLPDFQIF